MERMYQHDSLTGLYNRAGFYKELDALTQDIPSDDSRKCLVASVDLDGLKHINDTYGHAEGDYAITAVANALHQVSLPDKLCARFGGDEMVLFAPVADTAAAASTIRNEITLFLNDLNLRSQKPYRISASIGIYSSDRSSFHFDQVLQQSDMDLYQEKSSKANPQ